MKLFPLLFTIIFFTSCAGVTPSSGLDAAQTGLKYTVGPAVTAFLILEKDPVKRAKDAAYVYAGATALKSAATGEVLSPEQLRATVIAFVKDDERYIALASVLINEYSNVYPLFKIENASPVKFLTEIADRASNAAQPFLSGNP